VLSGKIEHSQTSTAQVRRLHGPLDDFFEMAILDGVASRFHPQPHRR
jgi:hypothetical protein